jgi:hypothetical protein
MKMMVKRNKLFKFSRQLFPRHLESMIGPAQIESRVSQSEETQTDPKPWKEKDNLPVFHP